MTQPCPALIRSTNVSHSQAQSHNQRGFDPQDGHGDNSHPAPPIPTPGVEGPVVLVIMDGIGIGAGDNTDAVATAHTPTLDTLARTAPIRMQLQAHGHAVGLPSDDDMGNSEVGHNALGAGRVFDQGAKRVSEAIRDGSMFTDPNGAWQPLIAHCLRHQTPLHFIGLLSDGNVHSHIDHLIAMVQHADSQGLKEVYVHVLLDGRDVPKTSALTYLDQLEAALAAIEQHHNKQSTSSKSASRGSASLQRRYRIASGGGRMMITMDRYEADWPMVERGWHTHVLGQGRLFASARQAVVTLRSEHPGITDQDLPPFVIADPDHVHQPIAPIRDGSAVIAFNFRGDRMLELTRAFEEEDTTFKGFVRGARPDVLFAGMTLYDGDTHRPQRYLVAPPHIACTVSERLCAAGVSQYACSETQKFGHVTYFWNGNRSGMFDPKLELYQEIPSYAAPFDQRPDMRAPEIAQALIQQIQSQRFRFLRVNFANGDMVGHTGNFEATVRAVEAVDRALATIVPIVRASKGALLVTADHGNADDMFERDKKTNIILRDNMGQMVAKTSHSLNPVPFYVTLPDADRSRFRAATPTTTHQPGLANVAATITTLLGFAQPTDFLPSLVIPTAP